MKAKDALMRTFGSKSSVKGKVISVAKTKWRVEWTIREATIVLDHGKAFWKPKITPPTNGDVGSVSGPVVENDRLEEEDDRGDHEMEAARDDDNEGHEEGEDEANDPLKCKLGGEFLKWEKLNSGVIVDQRAKDGWGNKFFRVHWPRETAHQEHKTEEECRNLLFPVHWLMVHWVGLMHHCLTWMFLLNINLSSALESYMESVFYHQVAFVSCGTRQQMDLYRQ